MTFPLEVNTPHVSFPADTGNPTGIPQKHPDISQNEAIGNEPAVREKGTSESSIAVLPLVNIRWVRAIIIVNFG